MIKVVVNNSLCSISGLNDVQFRQLRELLSYKTSAQASYFSGSYRGNQRYLLDKRGEFPTGLLYLVKGWLKKQPFYNMVQLDDRRVRPSACEGFELVLPEGVEPRPEQVQAAVAAGYAGRGIIVAPTGLGKSIIAALIVRTVAVPTLIVVPSLELKRQLTESLRAYYPDERVGGLGDTIAVENVDALDVKKPLKGYGCVIIDEFHHSGAATYRKLNRHAWGAVYYKFGLTATPFRSKDEERLLLESVLSEVIYRVEYKTAVDRGYIVPMEAYYFELPKQSPKGMESSRWASVYSYLVTRNELRNRLLVSVLDSLHEAGKSTLCLVKEIEHGKQLMRDCAIDSAFANGQDGSAAALIAEFNACARLSLIATEGVAGEGVDTRPAEFIVIAGLGKSKNSFMQKCGRGFRNFPGKVSCKLFLIKDPSHKWTLAHFAAQVKILKEEYGIKPQLLPLPEGIV